MFCPQCGNQVPDGSRFCGKCGAQLSGGSPAPAPAAGPSVAVAPKKGPGPRAKLAIVAVVALAVVGAAIFGIVSCVRGGGHGSAQDVANGLGSAINKAFEGNFSSEAVAGAMDDLIDLMPQQAVDQALQKKGLTRDDVADELMGQMGMLDSEEVQGVMSAVDIKITTSVGAELSADELASMNESLGEYGLTATEGNHIAASVEMSALGQTQSQDAPETGMVAVKIDGAWYLWGSGISF